MPELPEVETIRLQLNKILPGKTVQSVIINNPKSFVGKSSIVTGRKIVRVRRFAKVLVIDLDLDVSLAIHLKMTGQLLYRASPNKHTRVVLTFSDGDRLYFNDQRKFGWMRVLRNATMQQFSNVPMIESIINNLGPDALNELTVNQLENILKTSKRPIKLLLMDQAKIGGVGNIYANEALFLSRIDPKLQSGKVSKRQSILLFKNLQKVLKDGIKWKGASRNHFRDIYGKKGMVQEHFSVYDREGNICVNKCGGKIMRFVLGGRSTFYCPNCQNKQFLIQ
ncbi:bifunctional DNA-formamidopyrimidine glycosylase/DNA-(apurinic or apyrimidinic site) lyase [Candidatus Gottesmanbacteria bacterium]|nr:bifunctional DNA-formamidopyrimidine glycosylase/DNA-(apurinic or apyrimidinic site) lyase [Candidatus Gottesmanbacteria bacterium]